MSLAMPLKKNDLIILGRRQHLTLDEIDGFVTGGFIFMKVLICFFYIDDYSVIMQE